MSWVMVAVGVGTGVAKSELVDRPKEDRQRKLAAATQRYSPWTGLKAQPVQEADPFGSALQGGMAGATFAQQNSGKGAAAPATTVNVGNSGNDMSKPMDWDSLFDTRRKGAYWSTLSSGGQ